MPGFVSGLIHAGAVGLTGLKQGQEEQQRKLLAQAALRRTQQREDEELNLRRITALREAKESGLEVTPQGSERSGDMNPEFNSVGASIRGVAGPAEVADPTRLGTIGGMDIKMPANMEPKSVRDKRAAIAAGVERPPEQTLHQRIIELRGQGMKPEEAIRQARGEYGQDPDPRSTYRANRDYAASHPISGGGGGASPERRAQYVLRRASQLTKPRKEGYIMKPGLSRADAEQMAGEEYDRVHGVDNGVTTPSKQPSPQSKGDINLATDPAFADVTGSASSTATRTAGGDNTLKTPTAAQQARASVDPQYKAFLKAKKYKVQ